MGNSVTRPSHQPLPSRSSTSNPSSTGTPAQEGLSSPPTHHTSAPPLPHRQSSQSSTSLPPQSRHSSQSTPKTRKESNTSSRNLLSRLSSLSINPASSSSSSLTRKDLRSQVERSDSSTGNKDRKGKGKAKYLDSTLSEMNNFNALRAYAKVPSPKKTIPANVLLHSNNNTIAIFDAYPKAKYHFLILPRYPFIPNSDPDSDDGIVNVGNLDDLRSLLLKTSRNVREQVIDSLNDMAREVEEMIRDEMIKTEGFEWRIDVGFHAIPSMKHLHLHVISEDRISDSMKTKKHYNSFRPDLGFFISIMDVQRWLQEDDAYVRERVNALFDTDPLLTSQLSCFKCDEPFSSMPKLKAHLEKEFAKEKKEAREKIKRTGRQRSEDDNMF